MRAHAAAGGNHKDDQRRKSQAEAHHRQRYAADSTAVTAALRSELVALRGDVGARRLLARHIDELVTVPTDDPAIFFDVDTAEDLARLSVG